MKLDDKEIIYSGRKAGMHRQVVGFMVKKEAATSSLGWEGNNNRMLITHLMTMKCKISYIVVYAPVDPTDGERRVEV